jgi:NAD(P)-dependent dehydrogenase (short-subunit alcohol dehydrogenase family)
MAGRGVVVVTGSSTGIGRACAVALDRQGFHVLAGVRKEADGESLEAAAAGLEPVIVDVTDAATIEALRAKVEAEHGGRLAGLLNNAGISVAGPVEGVPVDEWRRQFEVNVIGQVAVTKALLPALRAAKGRVAFMSSVGGRNAIGLLGPYGASKHAIEAIGDSLRQEMQPFGVNVAIIEPGSVATPIWEKGLEDAAASRAALGEEVDRLYGERLDAFAALAEKTGAAGVPPEDVAKAVTHALTADRPKTRYVVGRDARAQLAMKAILPDRGLDRLIARMVSGA